MSIEISYFAAEHDNQVTIDRFQEYLEYPDAKVYTIQTLARHPKKSTSPIFRQNLLKFLEILNYDEGGIVGESALVVENYEIPTESVAKNFNTLWQDFGKIQHKEVEMYKRLLILLTDKVLPVLKNPLGFTDFLMESYNVGGSIRYAELLLIIHSHISLKAKCCFCMTTIPVGNLRSMGHLAPYFDLHWFHEFF